MGAEVVLVGPASSERKAKAEELAATHGYTVIPPYDDPAIVAGQATCGLEIVEQLGDGSGGVVVLSPVSGGGLLSGISTAVKLASPEGAEVQVWGAEPELSADAKESFDTKTLVEWPATKTTRTIADGLRTQSLGVLNFAHILRFVDGIVTVSEDEIKAAMRVMLAAAGLVSEPSGAVTLAAALYHHAQLPACERMVAVLSGGNIEPALRQELEAVASA
jgi:threonine dehydratase